MTSLETYKIFLGVTNHFFKPSYDFFKYGPVPVKPQTLEDKLPQEKYRFERLSKKFTDQDSLVDFITANCVAAKKKIWVGDLFGGDSDRIYNEWKGHTNISQAQYIAIKEIKHLVENHQFNDLFVTPDSGQHPEILKSYLRNTLSLETFVLLDMCVNFFPRLTKDLGDDRTWLNVRNKSNKYRPFINRIGIDINQLRKSFIEAIREVKELNTSPLENDK